MRSLSINNYALVNQTLSLSAAITSPATVSTIDNSIAITYSFDSLSSWESNIKFDTDVQAITELSSGVSFTKTLNLTWSTNGTDIVYVLQKLQNETIPLWINFNTTTGVIDGTAPDIKSSKIYSFYVNATSTEWTGVAQKLITLEVDVTPAITPIAIVSSAGAAAAAQAGAAAGMGASMVSSTISGSPPTGIWAIIHQLQYILLLLMVDDFIPEELQIYIEAQSSSMMNFNFLPFDSIPGVNIPVDWMDFQQPNAKLELLEIESRSTFNNLLSVISLLAAAIWFHVLLLVTPCWKEDSKWKFMRKLKFKILYLITWVFYVRLLMESNQMMILASSSEMYTFDDTTLAGLVSLLIAFTVFCITLIFFITSLFYFYKFRNGLDPKKKFIFQEFFLGLKNKRWARFFTPAMLGRRFILVWTIIFLTHLPRQLIFSIILIFQLLYWSCLVFIRPFEQVVDNIIEILNESFNTFFVCYIFAIDKQKGWTPNGTIKFFTTWITVNSTMVALIMLGKPIINIFRKHVTHHHC